MDELNASEHINNLHSFCDCYRGHWVHQGRVVRTYVFEFRTQDMSCVR
jgi:hypothetical protein